MATKTSVFNLSGFWILLAIPVAVTGLLAYGYYLQYVEYLDPCPLCMTQRFFYYVCGIIALIGLFGVRRRLWQKLIAGLVALSAIGGLVTAGRQIWLQHLPPEQVPECGLGLTYWLQNEPMFNTLKLLFQGDGNCAEVQWRFLGFSIADWSFFWFACIFLACCYLLIRKFPVASNLARTDTPIT